MEIWKDIDGYTGRYQVSDKGNIRTLFGRVSKLKEPKIMTLEVFTVSQTQYKRVMLSNPRKKFLVHRLVGKAFVQNSDNKPQINHIDNNGLNNVPSNLEWTTQSENLIHAQKQGRLTNAQQKGGISQGILAKAKAKEEAENLVGTKVNDWKVLKHLGLTPTGTVLRETLLCECKCGIHHQIHSVILLANKATCCRQCAKNLSSKKLIEDTISSVTDIIIGTWTITGNTNFVEGMTSRKVKFQAICTVCATVSVIPQPSIIGTKEIKKCPNCSNNRVKI